MSDIVIITFDKQNTARKMFKDLKKLDRKKKFNLQDAAIVEKDEAGEIKVDAPLDYTGVVGDSASQAKMIAASLLGGAMFGAMASKLRDEARQAWRSHGVDRQFVDKVGESLTPGSSAIFILIREVKDAEAVDKKIHGLGGQVFRTSFPEAIEADLQAILAGKK